MLKPFLFLSAAALLVIVSLSAPATPPQAASSNSSRNAAASKTAKASADTQAMAKAKQVYNIDCALCHGANGDGKTDVAKDMGLNLVDWTDPKSLADRQDQELFNIIRNGKDKMPSEATGRASDAEVKNLIVYIRGMAKDQSASVPAAPAAPAAPADSSQAPPNPQQ
jgi:mono/diheme cytochrome c family protein